MTEEKVKIEARKLVDKGFKNSAAITAILFQKGCEGWRFDKLHSFIDQEKKIYTQELLRKERSK